MISCFHFPTGSSRSAPHQLGKPGTISGSYTRLYPSSRIWERHAYSPTIQKEIRHMWLSTWYCDYGKFNELIIFNFNSNSKIQFGKFLSGFLRIHEALVDLVSFRYSLYLIIELSFISTPSVPEFLINRDNRVCP